MTDRPALTYIQRRIGAAQDNLRDVLDTASRGEFDEVVHAIGFESTSNLSRRMMARRNAARQVIIPLPNRPSPPVPSATPGGSPVGRLREWPPLRG